MVFVGEATANLSHDDQLKVQPNYQVVEHHTHPRFDMRAALLTDMNDLALIKLNQSIRAGAEASICLPDSGSVLVPNEYGMIAGWGGSNDESLDIGYLKINYHKIEEDRFILTSKIDDVRLCEVSFWSNND